jgi:lysozyme family protein
MKEKELFEKALAIVLEFEGYKTEDTGGRTVYGISENAHPEAVEKMWNLSKAEALEIAKRIYSLEYWEKLFGDCPFNLSEQPEGPAFAICLFDTGVNLGLKHALKLLDEVFAEGMVGLDAAKEYILWARVEHYVNLAKNEKYRPYLRGWLNRVIQLRKKVREI